EIVNEAGTHNNYIFGADAAELKELRARYDPKAVYAENSRVRRVTDSLVDGSLSDGGTGMFRELYNSILEGAEWHPPDVYFLLHDFESYADAKLRALTDYADRDAFSQKCFLNAVSSGYFSSDRTVKEYAKEIWKII
ncbi:MAG TPA: glycogen phosphorylase, partial [Ruminococcaceae bacterium]|nr:glycogen phosphorylase [Oscillospiraceae bacterium]